MPRLRPLLVLAAALLLPAAAFAERVEVNPFRVMTVKPGQRCSGDASYAQWQRANGISKPLLNHYFVEELVFDGKNCVQPPSCDTWACPKKGVTKEWNSYNPTRTRTEKNRGEAEVQMDNAMRADYAARELAYRALPAGSATLMRKGQVIASGPLDQVLAQARTGDRIELGKGLFPGAALKKVADGLTLIGQGPETVLQNVASLPARGYWFEHLTLVNPTFEQTFYAEGRTNILVRVNVDVFANYGSIGGHSFDSVVMILGSVGRLRPMAIHQLPSRAFGTHVATMNEYGEMIDLYAMPESLPEGPLRQWLAANIPAGKPQKVEKALKAPIWKTLPDIDPASAQGIAAAKAAGDLDPGMALALSAIRSWLAPTPAGGSTTEDPVIAAVMADLDANRPLSALLRASRAQSSDFMVADRLVSLRREALKAIATAYGCTIELIPEISKRGPQNSDLRWDNVPYDETLRKLGVLEPGKRYQELVPIAALATLDVPTRCSFTTRVGLDAWQYEKTVGTARVEKTEWYLSAQGQAKQRAALNAALSGLDQSFNAAASSIESTWKSFDAYRTRIQTTQTGDQYLLSYQGDRNAGNRTGFTELERLRQQVRSQSGPGAAGDYYPMTTYVIDARQKFRHRIEFTSTGMVDQKAVSGSGPRVLDQTWDGPPCQDRFIDNSSEIRTGGTDCYWSNGYKVTAMLGNEVGNAFIGFVRGNVLPGIDVAVATRRKSARADDQAEAALVTAMMARPAAATDAATLKKVFGNDVTPDSARKTLTVAAAGKP